MTECSKGPGKGLRCPKPPGSGRFKGAILSSLPKISFRRKEKEDKPSKMSKGPVEQLERDFPGDIANEMGIKKSKQKGTTWSTNLGSKGYKFIKGGIKK